MSSRSAISSANKRSNEPPSLSATDIIDGGILSPSRVGNKLPKTLIRKAFPELAKQFEHFRDSSGVAHETSYGTNAAGAVSSAESFFFGSFALV